jgi:hypothetical protein
MPRRPTLLAAVLIIAALGATPAHAAVTVGLADQKPAAYGDARARALGLNAARLIVPYDAATSEPAAVQAWLDAVAAAGMTPHVAFEHLRSDACPGRPCTIPSRGTYAAAVRRFVAGFPQVRTYTTWNEANHESQPVWNAPEAVAGYYDELRAACRACTIVAGDVLDSGSYVRWLQRFRAASTTTPQLWGLHDYGDVNHATTAGVDAVLSVVPGTLWIEETGGIVSLRNGAGRVTFTQSEAAAAAAVDRAFAIAASRPRIGRMYIYHWQARAGDRFDAGLVRPDGTARPSYDAVARGAAAARAATAATTSASVTWTATWSARKGRRQLVLRARCRVAGRRCAGRVSVRLYGARIATRRAYATTAARPVASLRITVGRKVWRRAHRARAPVLALVVTPTRPMPSKTERRLELRTFIR